MRVITSQASRQHLRYWRSKAIKPAVVVLMVSISTVANALPVAHERHQRCGFDRDVAAKQQGLQQVVDEIIGSESGVPNLGGGCVSNYWNRINQIEAAPEKGESSFLDAAVNFFCNYFNPSSGTLGARVTRVFGLNTETGSGGSPLASQPSAHRLPLPPNTRVTNPVFGVGAPPQAGTAGRQNPTVIPPSPGGSTSNPLSAPCFEPDGNCGQGAGGTGLDIYGN